jgi:spermidine synthase
VETHVQSVPPHPQRNPGCAARAVLVLLGFSAVIGQVVLTRQLIVVFNGNEMSLGFLQAAWLFWTAAGSALASAFALGRQHPRGTVAALQCLLALALPPTLWALCAARAFFQSVPGELVGPVPMIFVSLACLSLFCIVSGALFVAAASLLQQQGDLASRRAAGSAYLLDSAGSAVGGILASLVFLRWLDAFQIVAVVALLNLFLAAVLVLRLRRWALAVSTAAVVLAAIPLLRYAAPLLQSSAQTRLWRGFSLVASRDSIYGNLAVTETGPVRSLYDNGTILGSAPDEAAAEESVQYAMLEHPAPRRVLMIGGGVAGALAQALEHPTVERIDYVELDPALIAMARAYFPVQASPIASDPRVHTHLADGRYYLRTTPDRFDVIILDTPDPQTAQLNRFYTVEFFRIARAHLAPGGLLALQLRSAEETLSPTLAEFLRCIQHTLTAVFPYVTSIPGETIHFFAATQPGVLTRDPHVLVARLLARNLPTQYVREYFIPFRMMPDRLDQIDAQLSTLPSTPINRDFAPIAYYFDIALWTTQFSAPSARWFQAAARLSFIAVLAAVLFGLLLAAFALVICRPRAQRARPAAACCVAATGFTAIALEIMLLLAFQSIYGYLYRQLAILIGLFMAGMALGSWLGIRRTTRGHQPSCGTLAATQCLLAFSAPALVFALSLLAGITSATGAWVAAQCLFPVMAALAGLLGGYQFPIAAEIYLLDPKGRPRLGILYAVDLLGGCLGALLLAAYLVPVFGLWRTALLVLAVNAVPALMAARIGLESRQFQS